MELIKISEGGIGGAVVQTVNARDLHEFIENRDHFTTWIADRIKQYDFKEGIDYVSFSENSEKGGRPRIEYALTLDMGKELSMVERNPKGKEARQYFIGRWKIAILSPSPKRGRDQAGRRV
jgi:anti-repressor protein